MQNNFLDCIKSTEACYVSFSNFGSKLINHFERKRKTKEKDFEEEKKSYFAYFSAFLQYKSKLGFSPEYVDALLVWVDIVIGLSDYFLVPQHNMAIEVCEELLEPSQGNTYKELANRLLGSLLSSQALLVFKQSISYQMGYRQMMKLSNYYFEQCLESNSESYVTYFDWAISLQRICQTTLDLKELCALSMKIGEYFNSTMKLNSSIDYCLKCLDEWSTHIDYLFLLFNSTRVKEPNKKLVFNCLSLYLNAMKSLALTDEIPLGHLLSIATMQGDQLAESLTSVVDILDELHRSSNIESIREIALSYQQTIKEYYQNLAEMSLANRNLYNKLLEEAPKEVLTMINQAAIDPQLIYQNYELFRNCLYWNCDHRHPMFKAERHRNNGEGERYITIEVDKIHPFFRKGNVKDYYGDLTFVDSGTYSNVYVAEGRNLKGEYAIKTLKKKLKPEELRKNTIINEVAIMKKCRHLHVINFIEAYYSPEEEVSVVLEYAEGGSLEDLISYIDFLYEDDIAFIMNQLCRGVQALHNQNVVHRDLKPSNILFNKDGTLKICDFGFAEVLKNDQNQKLFMMGTGRWMAPEIIEGLSYHLPVDIWAIGCIVFEMASGKTIFHRSHALYLNFKIVHDGCPFLESRVDRKGRIITFSRLIESFLDFCFQRSPLLRGNIHQLLMHKFLTSKYPSFRVKKFHKKIYHSKLCSLLGEEEYW